MAWTAADMSEMRGKLSKMKAENKRLREACVMAQSRFADLGSVIRKDGGYDNAGFMEASAQRIRDALDGVLPE